MTWQSGTQFKRLYIKYSQVLFPSRCLLCGGRLLFQNEKGVELCNHCSGLLVPLTGRRCEKCSLPLISEHRMCMRCRERSYLFKTHYSLFQYRGNIRELLYFYKFRQKYLLASLFSRLLYKTISEMFPHYPLVPVPSRKHLLKNRDRDHLMPVINILKKEYKIGIVNCLQRKGDIPQKELSFEERKKNLYGKISMKKGMRLTHPDILLFDDIFTTGATADECSRILLNNGARNVSVITIAID